LTSLGQHISDVSSATEAVDRPSVRHALSTTKHEELRNFLLSDSYAFTYIVCGHRELVPEVHMPVSYAATGSAQKLAWVLTQSGFEGYVIDQFRKGCRVRGINPSTAEGVAKLDAALDWVNFRLPRGTFKSSVITHGGGTFTAIRDPNTTAKITTALDDKAWELNKQIGKTIISGIVADLFPERVPASPHKDITEAAITLGGRTISHPQPTISAFGYLTKDVGGHYDTFWTNDLVVGGPQGNATPTQLPGVRTWLTGMSGYFMVTRRVRRIHEGTCWDEDDDHAFLTSGKRASACFSIHVPIEVHEGEVVNILERGTPTMPTFLPAEKIQQIQDAVLSDEKETEGAQSWRCNYLLNPGAGGGRLFSAPIVNDPDRSWMGPYEHPKAKLDKQYANRFMVGRVARDEQGRVLLDKDGKVKKLLFDPWKDLDRVITLDPAWSVGADNWALTVAGVDHQMVKFQLETRSATTGVDGWIDALLELDAFYKPRVIGFDKGGYQDPVIQNMLKTDRRLRKLKGRIFPVPHNNINKKARIRAGVAEPLKMFRWLLLPASTADEGDFGAQATRDEMIAYKGDPKAVDGILDSLAMVDAIARRTSSEEERREYEKVARQREAQRRRMIDPVLGVPLAA
jgi:hypothetical protein